jgi:hypothetical protein
VRVVGFNDGAIGTLISGSIPGETCPDYILAASFREPDMGENSKRRGFLC